MYRSTLPSSYLPKEHALDKLRGALFAKRLHSLPDEALRALDPAVCSASFLDTLAVFYSVDFYRNDLLEADKRGLILHSIRLKRTKGTVGALKSLFASLRLDSTIDEWFRYGGAPFHFKVDIGVQNREITTAFATTLTAMIERYKNVRSVLEALQFTYVLDGVEYVASGMAIEAEINLKG